MDPNTSRSEPLNLKKCTLSNLEKEKGQHTFLEENKQEDTFSNESGYIPRFLYLVESLRQL